MNTLLRPMAIALALVPLLAASQPLPEPTTTEAPPCHKGQMVVRVIRERGAVRVEPAGARQDPAIRLAETSSDPGSVKDWRLLAPLTRALDPMAVGASLRPAAERGARVIGCTVIDAHEQTADVGDSLAQYASAITTLRWRGENYDLLLVRAIPFITDDARQLVLYARVTLLRSTGMAVPDTFDLELRSSTLPGADANARVAALAADGAKAFHAWRDAAFEELVALAFHGPTATEGTAVEDPRWHRTGKVVMRRPGRAVARFDGRLVSAVIDPNWAPEPEVLPR